MEFRSIFHQFFWSLWHVLIKNKRCLFIHLVCHSLRYVYWAHPAQNVLLATLYKMFIGPPKTICLVGHPKQYVLWSTLYNMFCGPPCTICFVGHPVQYILWGTLYNMFSGPSCTICLVGHPEQYV